MSAVCRVCLWTLRSSVEAALLVILCLPFASGNSSWDVIVASDKGLELLNSSGAIVGNITDESTNGSKIAAVTFNPETQRVFFGETSNPKALILEYKHGRAVPLVEKGSSGNLDSLAYDMANNVIYWIECCNSSGVWRAKLSTDQNGKPELAKGEEVLALRDIRPRELVVDKCSGYMYWISLNANNNCIERAQLDGSGRETVIEGNIHFVYGLALDKYARKLYWTNWLGGIRSKIERSNLDGSDRQVFVEREYERPHAITVDDKYVYWSHWGDPYEVWRLRKHRAGSSEKPSLFRRFNDEKLVGLAAYLPERNFSCDPEETDEMFETSTPSVTPPDTLLSQKSASAKEACDNYCLTGRCRYNAVLSYPQCECDRGHTGPRCEVNLCHNFCFNGRCGLTESGEAVCDCPVSFTGRRCEKNVCDGYCLNEGSCHMENSVPQCKCQKGFIGARCEEKLNAELKELCNSYCFNGGTCIPIGVTLPLCMCPTSFEGERCEIYKVPLKSESLYASLVSDTRTMVVVVVLTVTNVVFLSLLLLAAWKLRKYKRYPRLKKRVIVNKGVLGRPLGPNQQQDSCEFVMENCCNMNVCETPCFEPNSRTVKSFSKKEEKRQLLDDMDVDSCGPCHSKDINVADMF